ncbi:MAG: histidine kinase [Bacteroidetes bacterium]|nr:MAG: histidine kinase [Bacteroidota bacterium]
MRKDIPFYILFLLTAFHTASCTGQNQKDQPEDKQATAALPDHDPYFIESNVITSAYGPQSITRNIIQDRNGNIWLATWEGIMRYDGQVFSNFTNKDSLRRFHVFAILEASDGNIWFGTIGAGVYRFDGSSFINYTTKEGLANDRVGCIYEDKAGNIWIGTMGGVSCYDGNYFRNYTTKEGLPNNDINSIIEDKNGTFWIGTRGAACHYDGKTFSSITNLTGGSFTNVRTITEDSKGNIWLGGNDGLWRYSNGLFTNFTSNFVGYIYEDSKGNIWTSSESPDSRTAWVLSRYNETALNSGEPIPDQILKQEGMFFGISEDRNGGIWFGTLNGACRYDGKTFNYFKNNEVKD